MKKAILALLVFTARFVLAQSAFEGTITITYQNEKNVSTVTEMKVKGKQVYIKQMQNGNPKYDHFIVNLETQDFYTVAGNNKKVILKYRLDTLLNFYERENLKEGYVQHTELDSKLTDKATEKDGAHLTKFVAENSLLKATGWVTDAKLPVNELIPLLRLLGSWNEVQGPDEDIVEADVNYKVGKRESSIKVAVKKEPIAKEIFNLPKDYQTKDFAKIMQEQSGGKELRTIIQTFAAF